MTHPAEGLSLEDRLAYLRAVAALVSVDADINSAELDSVHHLAESLGVEPDALDFDAFARDPDIALVEGALTQAATLGMGHALLTDAITIVFADGRIEPAESKVIAHYAGRLRVPMGQVVMLARYVAQAHATPDSPTLTHELIESVGAETRVQSPGVITRLLNRLRGRR